jgi:hypothetical protein
MESKNKNPRAKNLKRRYLCSKKTIGFRQYIKFDPASLLYFLGNKTKFVFAKWSIQLLS